MTTTWNINKMVCKVAEGGLINVVESVYWECKKSDGTNEVSEKGFCILAQPNENSFTPYDQLTKIQVISWIETTLGTDSLTSLNARLSSRLTAKATTVVLNPPFTN
jgi:hypothetical protein